MLLALLRRGLSDNKQHTRTSVSQEWVFLLAQFYKESYAKCRVTSYALKGRGEGASSK